MKEGNKRYTDLDGRNKLFLFTDMIFYAKNLKKLTLKTSGINK